LKKNGVLGRDVLLRKTMLDECKGEKFEEVISTFALAVLKKVCRSRHPDLDLTQIGSLSNEHLVPMILAYKHSLQQNLLQRRAISKHAENYARSLALEEAHLQQRQHEARQGFQPVDENDLAQFSAMVKNTWNGDDRWSEVLLNGQIHGDRSLPKESFEESWTMSLDYRAAPEPKAKSLVTELDERIAAQETRLKKWKTFHASLKNAQAAKQENLQPQKPTRKPSPLQFDKHHGLRLESQNLQDPGIERLEPYHASILKNMQNELSSNARYSKVVQDSGSAFELPGKDASSSSTGPKQPAEDSISMPSSPPVGTTVSEDTSQGLGASMQENEALAGSQETEERGTATLLKRTPASMLPFTPAESTPESRIDSPENVEDEDSQALSSLPEMVTRQGTLLERTRQSMSLLPNPPPKSRQSAAKQPHFSEVFPVNQFETPGKAQAEQHGAWSPRSGSSTPRDKLFSEEADYASVFKSRPRIAVSPSLSPERSNLGSDGMLAEGVDDLNLEDEGDTPSRGPRRQGR
jgi:uncharacterized coiled-coil protein SlyX